MESVDNNENIIVYAENGFIKVVGAESFKLYNISGQNISENMQLTSGIYIVEVNGKSYKIAVK